MDDLSVLAAWAAAISSFVGPLFGVFVAYQMQRNSDRSREAAQLFRVLMQDTQTFRHELLEVVQFSNAVDQIIETKEKAEALRNQVAETGFGSVEKAKAAYESTVERHSVYEQRLAVAQRELKMAEAKLNADKLSLGLLFDKKSHKCGRAIDELIMAGSKCSGENMEKFQQSMTLLSELVQRILDEMKPLYESLRTADSFSDDA